MGATKVRAQGVQLQVPQDERLLSSCLDGVLLQGWQVCGGSVHHQEGVSLFGGLTRRGCGCVLSSMQSEVEFLHCMP